MAKKDIDMFEQFMKMTQQQRDFVYHQMKNATPGIQRAYERANKAAFMAERMNRK